MKYTCTDCGGEQEGVEGALFLKGWVFLSGHPLCPLCVKLRRWIEWIAEENVILKDMERSENMSWKNCGCSVGEACEHAGEKNAPVKTETITDFMGTPLIVSASVTPTPASALSSQVGGGHYKDMKIQPVEYIHKNGIGFAEGCVIKYVSRWRAKGGVEDLKKARHFLDLLIELEGDSP